MKKFGELLSNVKILTALEKEGFTEPTEIQEKSIPVILSGADMLGKSRTGSGKTFAFGLPIIEKIDIETDKVQALIVCPTRELARQVTLELRKVANACDRIKIVPIYGGEDMAKQIAALKSAKIVVGTPGRIMDHLGRRTLKLDCLKVTVLDEADEMLNMGFRDDIEAIMKACPKYRQNIMFSATMPKPIAELTSLYLKDPVTVEIGAGLSTY
ncbi:dead-box atp-dependent rna helicase 47 mitochondrial [Holotrichia oblita]|nr:dead-box atp-dependent rna helicase 47 mitochondrial [Holotrichia oblita]